MAHFAELKVMTDPTGFTSDSHQVVQRVVVVGNDVTTAAGPLGPTLSVAPGTNSKSTLPGPAGGCTVMSFTVTGTLTIS